MKIFTLALLLVTSFICEASLSHRDDFTRSYNQLAFNTVNTQQDCRFQTEKSPFKISSTFNSLEKLRRDDFSVTHNYCIFVKSYK